MEPIVQITIPVVKRKIRLTEKRYERFKYHLCQKLLGLVMLIIGIVFVALCAKWTNGNHVEDCGAGLFMIAIGMLAVIAG